MSDLSRHSTSFGSESPQIPERIPHFDATARRRERMRHHASNGSAAPIPGTSPLNGHASAGASNAAAPLPVMRRAGLSPPTAPVTPVAVTHPIPVEQTNGRHDSGAAVGNGTASRTAIAPAAAAKTAQAGPRGAELEQFLIDFVVEHTGYPADMVSLDADLEADLGIDSIKKAQLLGELSEKLDIRISDVSHLSLDDFPTLRHVRDFLEGHSGSSTSPNAAAPPPVAEPPAAPAEPEPIVAPPPPEPVPPSSPAAVESSAPVMASPLAGADLEQVLIDFVVEQTGYPRDMVSLDADLEADLGIDSIKKAQLLGELSERFQIRIADVSHLSLEDFPTLGHVQAFLDGTSPKPSK